MVFNKMKLTCRLIEHMGFETVLITKCFLLLLIMLVKKIVDQWKKEKKKKKI